jgi:hypothetical protein
VLHRLHRIALALCWLAGSAGAGCDAGRERLPGLELAARLEAHFEREAARWAEDPYHRGLLAPLPPHELEAFLRQVMFFSDRHGIVLGTAYRVEPHGGGVLRLLDAHWRPGGRRPGPDDLVRFEQNGRSLAFGSLLEGYRRRLFLPPGDAPPRLARMRFGQRTQNGGMEEIETDAYAFLALLVAREDDLARPFTNVLGQRSSADLLLRQAWDHYLAARGPEEELRDHTQLHLVELLLAYARRQPELDPARIQRRFLAVELARRDPEGPDASLRLGHYAESLGWLVAEPRLAWDADARRAARDWLHWLETSRFRALEAEQVCPLSHLLAGLRRIGEHRAALE